MMRNGGLVVVTALALLGCAATGATQAPEDAAAAVMAAERAFARSMADRDPEAFAGYLSEEAVFLSGAETLRGRLEVVEGWKPFFDGPRAPFSWEPEQVEVLPSGDLALSTGPVRNPEGDVIARFTTIWRLEAPGRWRVVFDRGCPECPAPSP